MTPITAIQGSDGRADDFDVHFRPLNPALRRRWVDLAVEYERGVSFPPVELVQVEDVYFVRNGHHRISVAKAFGQCEIEAVITVWESCAEREAIRQTGNTYSWRPKLWIGGERVKQSGHRTQLYT